MNLKGFLVECSGGCCQLCGYSNDISALEYHHIISETKKYEPSKIINDGLLDKVLEELPKCILVCSNCHKEIHSGTSVIPEKFNVFDVEYYNNNNHVVLDNCPICDSLKLKIKSTCSKKCASINANNVGRFNRSLFKYFLSSNSIEELSSELNVSLNVIEDYCCKHNLILEV